MLKDEPRLEPMTLFEYLQETYPGEYEGVLRTVQRRVERWKAEKGIAKEVMFPIRHEPGEMGLSDFTHLKNVEVTVAGKPFHHLLYHYRLAYSGWQSVQIIQGGESFVGLSSGLQNALYACGGVPQMHRTDSLSAAYRNLGGQKTPQLTRMYEELCVQYRMRPTRNNTGIAHENGAIESSHGHFKRRLCQALYRRGSFDFASIEQYQELIDVVIAKLNAKCSQKYELELLHLQPLPTYRTPDYEVLSTRVSCHSTISVRCILYTVPARLVGQRLTLHLYHDRLVGFVGTTEVVELPRLHVHSSEKLRRARCINYRHVIESLRRKPRAFLYCTWQDDLLPNDEYRALWQQLKTQVDPDTAARWMVEALYIAATQDKEAAVAIYLQTQIEQKTLTLDRLQQQFKFSLFPSILPQVNTTQHNLSTYDQLLNPAPTESLPEPEPDPQTPQTQSHPSRVAGARTPSHAGKLVLRSISPRPVRGRSQPPRPNPHRSRSIRSAIALRKILL
jgi:hypothetical protein